MSCCDEGRAFAGSKGYRPGKRGVMSDASALAHGRDARAMGARKALANGQDRLGVDVGEERKAA